MPAFPGQLETAPDSLGKESCLTRSLSKRAEWGGELMVRPFKTLSVSPDGKTHIIWALTHLLHPQWGYLGSRSWGFP